MCLKSWKILFFLLIIVISNCHSQLQGNLTESKQTTPNTRKFNQSYAHNIKQDKVFNTASKNNTMNTTQLYESLKSYYYQSQLNRILKPCSESRNRAHPIEKRINSARVPFPFKRPRNRIQLISTRDLRLGKSAFNYFYNKLLKHGQIFSHFMDHIFGKQKAGNRENKVKVEVRNGVATNRSDVHKPVKSLRKQTRLVSKKQNLNKEETVLESKKMKFIPRYHSRNIIASKTRQEFKNHWPTRQKYIPRRLKRDTVKIRVKRKSRSRKRNRNGSWMDQNAYKKIFVEYYKCLDKRLAQVRDDKSNSIKPVLLIVGQSVELKCDICTRPDQNVDTLGIDWQMLRRADGRMKHVDFGTGKKKKRKRMVLTKDYALKIKRATLTDAGQYFCVFRRNYASVYQLDILLDEKRRVLHEDDINAKLQPTLLLHEENLNISTVWTVYSFCDRCGQPGTQRKLGLCMVKKIDKSAPITPIDFPMIDLYPDGIPCHSTALPSFLKRLPELKMRASETLVRNCLQKCPTTPGPITITDKAGKVIEVIEPGFYSINHPPTIPPMTQRKVVYEDAGKHLVLSCPKQEKRVITIWKRNTVVINPLTIKKLTRNRVFIDQASRLHIRKLLLSDTASFLCFLQQKHIATFKVIVYDPMNEHLKDYISLGGMGLTCLSVVLICICLCMRKGQKTHR